MRLLKKTKIIDDLEFEFDKHFSDENSAGKRGRELWKKKCCSVRVIPSETKNGFDVYKRLVIPQLSLLIYFITVSKDMKKDLIKKVPDKIIQKYRNKFIKNLKK